MPEPTFDFITLRQPARISQKVKRLRYIRDIRADSVAPFRAQLEREDVYQQKIALAQSLASGPLFFTTDFFYSLKYETIVDVLRSSLRGPVTFRDGGREEGTKIVEIIAMLEVQVPLLANTKFFNDPNLQPAAVAALFIQYAVIWDSLYAVVVMAGIHQIETNHLIDSIRTLHILVALRLENLKQQPLEFWPYYDFGAYEAVVRPNIIGHASLN